MNLLWEYKSESFQVSDLGYYILHDNLVELFSVDLAGKCSSHVIGSELDIPKHYKRVLFDEKAWFMPLEFIQTDLPGYRVNVKALVDEGIYVAYQSDSGVSAHLVQPVYQKALQMIHRHKNLVYFWVHEQTLILLLFKEGQLFLGNIFEVQNHTEVVYFITAAMQDAKFDSLPFYLVCDANERDSQVLGGDFEKLGIHMDVFHNEKPYLVTGKLPDMIFANSLMYLISCALPEAF